MSLGFLLTANPLTAIIGHVAMHIATQQDHILNTWLPDGRQQAFTGGRQGVHLYPCRGPHLRHAPARGGGRGAGMRADRRPSQGHEMLFDAHTRSFAALGGVARRGIYDNMRTAVDKVKKGKGRVVNARFAAMCSHYLFDADFCNVASGWEKGVVEKNVQDSRRRIWIEARERKFGSFLELNAWLGERCKAIWADTPHPQHRHSSIAEVLVLEQEHLMGMPQPFDCYVEKPARVSSTCLVTVARNRVACVEQYIFRNKRDDFERRVSN